MLHAVSVLDLYKDKSYRQSNELIYPYYISLNRNMELDKYSLIKLDKLANNFYELIEPNGIWFRGNLHKVTQDYNDHVLHILCKRYESKILSKLQYSGLILGIILFWVISYIMNSMLIGVFLAFLSTATLTMIITLTILETIVPIFANKLLDNTCKKVLLEIDTDKALNKDNKDNEEKLNQLHKNICSITNKKDRETYEHLYNACKNNLTSTNVQEALTYIEYYYQSLKDDNQEQIVKLVEIMKHITSKINELSQDTISKQVMNQEINAYFDYIQLSKK